MLWRCGQSRAQKDRGVASEESSSEGAQTSSLSESEEEEEVDEEGGGVLLEGSGGQGDGGGCAGFLDPYSGERGIAKQLSKLLHLESLF